MFVSAASASFLPDITPAVTVDITGDFLSLIRARKEKSMPSLAMAKMIRGKGNMEPSRLGGKRNDSIGGARKEREGQKAD